MVELGCNGIESSCRKDSGARAADDRTERIERGSVVGAKESDVSFEASDSDGNVNNYSCCKKERLQIPSLLP